MAMEYFGQWRRFEYGWIVLCISYCFSVQASNNVRYSIFEELNEESVVGNLSKDLGLELNALVSRRFRIVSGSNDGIFRLNPNNGILYVNKKVDREQLCDANGPCIIDLKIVVENPLEIHYVGIDIVDVNDHVPVFKDKQQRVEIVESTPPGARFQLQRARDPDIGMNTVRSYKVSQNEHFDLEIRDRGDEKVPFLVLQKALDRERKSEHELILIAVDGGNPPRSGTSNVIVTVLDINDNRPVFSQEVYAANIAENIPIGTVVIQVNATDLDEGLNGEVIYFFGSNHKVSDIFHLDQVSGEIRIKGKIDFESTDVYRLDVLASDKGTPPMSVDCRVIVKILDVNDNIPEIDVTSLSSVVPEDSKPGTVISLISVLDKDSGINGKVLCTLSHDVPFELKPSIKHNMYSLVTKTLLNREETFRYNITLTATDLGQPPLSALTTINVQVSDVNDNSPEFSQNPIELYLIENNTPGDIISSVTATDKDINENAAISYSIYRQVDTKNDVLSFFTIDYETGIIRALRSFDFEVTKTFQFHVVATDSGSPPLSSNVTVNVFILDQNDNVPVILHPSNANGSAEGVEEVPRNVNPGHLVTKVKAYDADVGYNGWLLFSLQEVSDHSLFGLDRYTGQIKTLRSFTEADEAKHKLVILVKDNGNISLSASATVNIKVAEPKEALSVLDIKSSVKEEDENHVTFYLLITLGSVSMLFVISIIVLIIIQCSKSTNNSSAHLQDTIYDGTLCHSIQYRSGDKQYMLVGPRMSIGSTINPGSTANTLMVSDHKKRSSREVSNGVLNPELTFFSL